MENIEINELARVTWRELIVTDSDNDECGTLGDIVADNPAMLDTATIEGGIITVWPYYFIAAPGEDPEWDTPRGDVDWTGFDLSMAVIREK